MMMVVVCERNYSVVCSVPGQGLNGIVFALMGRMGMAWCGKYIRYPINEIRRILPVLYLNVRRKVDQPWIRTVITFEVGIHDFFYITVVRAIRRVVFII